MTNRRAVGQAVLRGLRVAALACLLFAAGAGAAVAEVQRVEAIGIYGIRDAMRTKVIPRDEAIADATWEGVSRVALELIGESGTVGDDELDEFGRITASLGGSGGRRGIEAPLESSDVLEARLDRSIDPDDVRLARERPSEDEAALLREALGKDMLPYTRSYRILEDQGELPVLFADSPGVENEYVVVMEVIVDVDRVSKALETAGLVTAEAQDEQIDVTLELVGLSRYEALEQVLSALRGPLGATRVSTVEFERGRQLIAVEGPFDADGLAARLGAWSDARLKLEPVALDPVYRRIRVVARWFPATDGAQATKRKPRAAYGR